MTSKVNKVFPATLSGQKTTAKKVRGRWLVGGDFDTAGAQVLLKKDGRYAWYTIRGAVAKFSDYAAESEIAQFNL